MLMVKMGVKDYQQPPPPPLNPSALSPAPAPLGALLRGLLHRHLRVAELSSMASITVDDSSWKPPHVASPTPAYRRRLLLLAVTSTVASSTTGADLHFSQGCQW